MIRHFTDHAANERTFLAWLRTGVSIVAFGFVVEKFNIFLATLELASLPQKEGSWLSQHRFPHGVFTQYEGGVLMGVGVAVIAASAVRFVRIKKVIDAQERRPSTGIGLEMALAAALAALTLAYCAHIFL
jgi:putative membrane protein